MQKKIMDRLKRIPELSFGDFDEMTDTEFAALSKSCTGYVRSYPDLEAKIENAVLSGNIKEFLQYFGSLCEMMKNVGAHEFVFKKIDKFSSDFLAAASRLSMDIQRASDEAGGVSSPTRPMRQGSPGNASSDNLIAPSILAVDDTTPFLTRLKNILSNTRYDLTCVNSGVEALDYLRHHAPAPDLLLIDTEMPEMDGYTLASKIREKGVTSPIVFLATTTTGAGVAQALKAGSSDIIVKSLSDTQIIERINNRFKKGKK